VFDFSFGEMLVVALVALVVLGPERLPRAARFAGLWVRKARAQWHAVKNELEQELANEDLRRGLDEARTALEQSRGDTLDAVSDAQGALRVEPEPPSTEPASARPPANAAETGRDG